jgi:hypothetical protein
METDTIAFGTPFARPKIAENILDCIGGTPGKYRYLIIFHYYS